MQMKVSFPGNLQVDVDIGDFTVKTDQPASAGGDGSAPAPFDLFLASIATCAGIYMLSFMKQRGIDPKDSGVTMRLERDPISRMIARIALDLHLPDGFPDKYEQAIVRSVNQCTVKRHIQEPPEFEVRTSRA